MYDFNLWSLGALIHKKRYIFIAFFLSTIVLRSAYYGKNCLVGPEFLASFVNNQKLSVGTVKIRPLNPDLIRETNISLIQQIDTEEKIQNIAVHLKDLRRFANVNLSEIQFLEEKKQILEELVALLEKIRPC